jgi:hypothetical protein
MRVGLIVAAVIVLSTLLFGATNASVADLRQKICNSNSDCVRIVGGTGNLMVDGLDFSRDTVDAIRTKLPDWFGPARPIQFLYREKVVEEDAKLAELGILIGGVMKIMSQVNPEL